MKTWLTYFWGRINGSLWFMPVLMSVGALVLAVLCVLLDETIARTVSGYGYLYAGDVESARTLLSTVAGSMITVAGVAFSVTMVALSLASSQFGPYLLANFMRDRGNQIVLGGFIATFLFCLLSLGATTGEAQEHASVSASIALVLATSSLMLLIYFIHHIATSMQADNVIEHVAEDVRHSLDAVFPAAPEERERPRRLAGAARSEQLIPAPRTGYLQAIDEAGLIRLASRHDLRLRMLCRPGHYVVEGTPLLGVSGGEVDDLANRLRHGFIVGGHRTAEQDPEYGIHQLVQVALRALSPGINDPFTAMACIDRLTGVLCRIGPRAARSAQRLDETGNVRLELDSVDFHGVLDAAYDQIRQFSKGVPSVAIRVLESLTTIATTVSEPERHKAIQDQASMLMAQQQDVLMGDDGAALHARFDALQAAIGARSAENAAGRP